MSNVHWTECKILYTCSSLDQTKKLFKEASSSGPVGGVFNLAMTLTTANFESQSPKLFMESAQSKILATQNLDTVTRNTCQRSLDHFVAFSTTNCNFGVEWEASYAYTSSTMDRICEKRRKDGLPGKCLEVFEERMIYCNILNSTMYVICIEREI